MTQEIDTDDVIKRIVAGTGLSREEITKRATAMEKEFGGLIQGNGALLCLADKLGVKTVDIAPQPDPVYAADAGECQYCHGMKTWGKKVPTKNGKMAPGHIDAEGHFIGDCPQFAPKNASKGTIFEQKVEKPATRQVMEPKKLAALLDKTFNEDMEAAVKVPTQEPMKVVPKIDEDALLADLLASTPPAPKVEATPTATEIGEEIVKLMKPKHPNVSFITAPEPAQSTTPNAAADTPTNVAADPSVRRDASATSGVDGTVVVVPEEPPGIDLVHVNGLKEALTCLPEYLASIDLKGLLVRLIEVTATIGTKLDGYRVILEQSAVTNTAALAELEERVKALEVKKPRKADKKAEE